LLWTLEKGLGDDWTPELADARAPLMARCPAT